MFLFDLSLDANNYIELITLKQYLIIKCQKSTQWFIRKTNAVHIWQELTWTLVLSGVFSLLLYLFPN